MAVLQSLRRPNHSDAFEEHALISSLAVEEGMSGHPGPGRTFDRVCNGANQVTKKKTIYIDRPLLLSLINNYGPSIIHHRNPRQTPPFRRLPLGLRKFTRLPVPLSLPLPLPFPFPLIFTEISKP